MHDDSKLITTVEVSKDDKLPVYGTLHNLIKRITGPKTLNMDSHPPYGTSSIGIQTKHLMEGCQFRGYWTATSSFCQALPRPASTPKTDFWYKKALSTNEGPKGYKIYKLQSGQSTVMLINCCRDCNNWEVPKYLDWSANTWNVLHWYIDWQVM